MTNSGVAACCVPLTGDVIEIEDAEQLAHRFKALGDPTRVRLLSLIAAYDERKPASATSPSRSASPSRPSRTT